MVFGTFELLGKEEERNLRKKKEMGHVRKGVGEWEKRKKKPARRPGPGGKGKGKGKRKKRKEMGRLSGPGGEREGGRNKKSCAMHMIIQVRDGGLSGEEWAEK